jgi:hypothetical protein
MPKNATSAEDTTMPDVHQENSDMLMLQRFLPHLGVAALRRTAHFRPGATPWMVHVSTSVRGARRSRFSRWTIMLALVGREEEADGDEAVAQAVERR